jgi:hypothetical protein
MSSRAEAYGKTVGGRLQLKGGIQLKYVVASCCPLHAFAPTRPNDGSLVS